LIDLGGSIETTSLDSARQIPANRTDWTIYSCILLAGQIHSVTSLAVCSSARVQWISNRSATEKHSLHLPPQLRSSENQPAFPYSTIRQLIRRVNDGGPAHGSLEQALCTIHYRNTHALIHAQRKLHGRCGGGGACSHFFALRIRLIQASASALVEMRQLVCCTFFSRCCNDIGLIPEASCLPVEQLY